MNIRKKLVAFFIILKLMIILVLVLIYKNKPISKQYEYFGQIPILHEGRLKPIQSIALIYLRKFCHSSHINGKDPNEWLVETLFNPTSSLSEKIFKVDNEKVKIFFSLDPQSKFFSYEDLSPKILTNIEKIQSFKSTEYLTGLQNDIINLYENVVAYRELSKSVVSILPLTIQIPKEFQASLKSEDKNYPSLFDLSLISSNVMARAKDIASKNPANTDKLTEDDKQIIKFAYQLYNLINIDSVNHLFRVIAVDNLGNKELVSLWSVMMNPDNFEAHKYIKLWEKLGKAYYNTDKKLWLQTSKELLKITKSSNFVDQTKIKLEYYYNIYDPLFSAHIFYFLGFLLSIAFIVFKKPFIYSYANKVLGVAIFLHSLVILTRMLILSRPPVGTLYESIIFIPLVISVLSFVYELYIKDNNGNIISSTIATILIYISYVFENEGDNITLLGAVLNTKFWLATHVVCITVGYAFTIIAGTMAHIYLFKFNGNGISLKKFYDKLHSTTIIALFFMSFGTLLGGIWADQSWGRFWGWDPKENGALLIILWLLWILHGKIGNKHLNDFSFAVLAACLNIIVSLSWFGVNLLSVGLHSYGFSNKTAYGLGAICGVELLMITFLSRKRHAKI